MARLHIPDYCAALNHIGFWSAPILYLDFRLGFLAPKARGKISYRGQATAFESVWKLLTILMELRRTCKLPIFSIIWETVLKNDTTGLQLSIAGRKWQFCGEFPLLVGMTRGREWCACANQSCCCWRGWDPPDSTLTHLFMPSHPQSLAPTTKPILFTATIIPIVPPTKLAYIKWFELSHINRIYNSQIWYFLFDFWREITRNCCSQKTLRMSISSLI